MLTKNKKLVVVLPAYNEEKDVEILVDTWQKLRERLARKYQLELILVVVNDGSMDQTEQICVRLEQAYDNFILVNHEKNKGLGAAVNTGLEYAVNNIRGCQCICLMDCDNTQDPHYIFSMLDTMYHRRDGFDVVIASRYQNGAKVHGLSNYRLLTSEGARILYSFLLPVKNVKDYTCGYRLYSKEIVEKSIKAYQGSFVTETGFTCMAEILYKIKCVGGRFAEVPFELHYEKKEGASKMRVLKTTISSIRLAIWLRCSSKIRKVEKLWGE